MFPARAAAFPVTFVGNSWPKCRKLRANIGQRAPGNREISLFQGLWARKRPETASLATASTAIQTAGTYIIRVPAGRSIDAEDLEAVLTYALVGKTEAAVSGSGR